MIFVLLLLSDNLFAQQKTLTGYTQGTTFHITYVDQKNVPIEDEVLTRLLEVDSSLSVYIPESLLSRWNNNKVKEIDRHIRTCWRWSKKINKQSGGAFDPTIFPILNYYGFGPAWLRDTTIQPDSLWKRVGFDQVYKNGKALEKKNHEVQMDFNAIAQGYSVDLICEMLDSYGIHNYLVEIGGEVRAKGLDENGNNWLVGIESAKENRTSLNDIVDIVQAHNIAIATSGNYRKFIESGGTRISHQIDPRFHTVKTSHIISATVLAKNAMLADAYATVFCLLDLEESKKLLRKLKQIDVRIIYQSESGTTETYESKNFGAYLK